MFDCLYGNLDNQYCETHHFVTKTLNASFIIHIYKVLIANVEVLFLRLISFVCPNLLATKYKKKLILQSFP
jgi:hypothetical protein